MSSFRDIGAAPLLTPAEELELSRLIQVGMAETDALRAKQTKLDPELNKEEWAKIEQQIALHQRRAKRAKDRMVQGNIRLACNQAAKYHHRLKHLDIEDLVQEAVFGLYRAAELFNPQRGYKFSTYAYGWINQSIRRAINNMDHAIRVPIHAHDQTVRFRKVAAENPGLSVAQIAKLSGASASFVELTNRARGVCSLNKITRGGTNELMDTLQAPSDSDDIGTLMAGLNIEPGDVIRFVDHLDPRESATLRLYYGLDGSEPWTLDAIGKKLGVSRERARQIREIGSRRVRLAFTPKVPA